MLLLNDDDGLVPRENLYVRGMNTSPGVFALYVVFMRYHNHVAGEIGAANDDDPAGTALTDDEIFLLARKKTIAVYQSFVEEKYLPTLLGYKLDPYEGYDPLVDPSIDEFFAAVSFRYAHTSLSGVIRLLDADFAPIPADPLYLRDTFKQALGGGSDILTVVGRHGGVEPFLRGLTVVAAKGHDASFVDDVNVWAEATTVLDVQRGRDVGIPPYNAVRRAMGLEAARTFEDLVGGAAAAEVDDPELVSALRALYLDDVELVDAYVGALVEPRDSSIDTMGPLFTRSIIDQFTRLRDGDRFWYRNLYPPEEYESFPGLSDIIKLVCDDMDLFPSDPYLLYHPGGSGGGDAVCGARANQLTLLGCVTMPVCGGLLFNSRRTIAPDRCRLFLLLSFGFVLHLPFLFGSGMFSLNWQLDNVPNPKVRQTSRVMVTDGDGSGTGRSIEVTLSFLEEMEEPGYIGIGWGKQEMRGAHIWFCTVNDDAFAAAKGRGMPESCSATGDTQQIVGGVPVLGDNATSVSNGADLVSCCLAIGTLHNAPQCASPSDAVFYSLEVTGACVSRTMTSVTLRAQVCIDDDAAEGNRDSDNQTCFRTTSTSDGRMDYIVAYNPLSQLRPHGYQRRTSSQLDLNAGIATQTETDTVDSGLIATHGIFMLVGWLFIAPWAVFIVRYLKTRSWHLVVHISIMGVVGSVSTFDR